MSDRRDTILDVAERMIRTSGYHGFSFREIAAEVGVKSASVHYHFPTKSDLAAAVAKRYHERFDDRVNAAQQDGTPPVTVWRSLFRQALHEDGLMCLCGILAVEGDDLPEAVAGEARLFFQSAMASIARADGLSATDGARVLAQLEGAMLLARSMGDVALFDQATAHLGAPPP
ncbi:MAG: TetR/AcrR family transcriptional regulator [Paracoccaceae bacterium]